MIRLTAEIWTLLAVCFLAGGLVGWLLSLGLRPLFASAARRDAEPAEAETILPLPVIVPPPQPRREPVIAAIDAGPTTVVTAVPVRTRPASPPARMRPSALAGPRHGRADPLTRIAGLSRRHADRLYAIGIYHFSQIAAWTPREVAWVADYLALDRAIEEEDWVGQAARLAASTAPRRPRS